MNQKKMQTILQNSFSKSNRSNNNNTIFSIGRGKTNKQWITKLKRKKSLKINRNYKKKRIKAATTLNIG